MAAIIAPDVVRYSIEGTYLNRPAVNVLDMVVLTGGVDTRHDDVKFVAGEVGQQWVDHIMPNLSSSYTLDRISYVDLDAVDGVVGSTTEVGDYDLPLAAGLGGQPITAAVAMLVTKETGARRGQRAGRWFLPGLTEAYVNGNILEGQFNADMNAGLSTFLADITETSPVANREYFPTVIHTRNAGTPENPNIVYVSNTQITDLNVSGRVSTQRRRNRP